MALRDLLGVRPGVTAVIGGGGKTTLLRTLGGELAAEGKRVLLCTTTKMLPFPDLPCALTGAELEALRRKHRLLCAGTLLPDTGKLAAPETPMAQLAARFDYMLVEADGAARRPLKAHAPHEPVIPAEANQTICVVGASGFGQPIVQAAHRPERYAALAGVPETAEATPETECQPSGDAVGAGGRQGPGGAAGVPGFGGQLTKRGVFFMLIVIRGAGDLATGVALRLRRAHMQVVMTDIQAPTAIRRTVCFSQAIVHGETTVEDLTARRAESPAEALELLKAGVIPVLADPEGACIPILKPDAVVDAILAKKNLGTKITDAPVVVGVGPGFTAGEDCHAVVETMRGHYLGRVIHEGSAIPNTGIPGLIGGFAGERVLRAPADGVFHQLLDIGAQVKMGDVAATVNGEPMICTLDGVLRGILADGTPVFKGMKAGDIDPRCEIKHCYCASDKALAVGGGVLEAILNLTGALKEDR